MVIWHLKQIGKVEKFSKWGPHELTKSQKNGRFEVLFYYSTQQRTISQSYCDVQRKVDFIQQPGQRAWWLELRRSSKALSIAELAPEKVMVTAWWAAAGLTQLSEFRLNHDL